MLRPANQIRRAPANNRHLRSFLDHLEPVTRRATRVRGQMRVINLGQGKSRIGLVQS